MHCCARAQGRLGGLPILGGARRISVPEPLLGLGDSRTLVIPVHLAARFHFRFFEYLFRVQSLRDITILAKSFLLTPAVDVIEDAALGRWLWCEHTACP